MAAGSVEDTASREQGRSTSQSPIDCELLCHSNSKHLQQIFTGFSALRRRGLIRLRQRFLREPVYFADRTQHLRDARHAHLRVLMDARLRLHYDTFDGKELDEEYLDGCDFYFKRSYDESYLRSQGYPLEKVKPLGLYYEVYTDRYDPLRIPRALALPEGVTDTMRKIVKSIPRIRSMEALPDFDAAPRILFNVKAFDPHNEPSRIPEKIRERVEINEMRAACIRALRKEFGADFFGGFVPSAYAREHFGDVLVTEPHLTAKHNYMKLLRRHPICVATTGLHGSIGGKFAEYVCLSKAILSERLNFTVPGPFGEGENYLQFSDAKQCVEQARRLFVDRDLRQRLMANNARYYNGWLRPDMLILNTLLTARSGGTL
jgi:hypothetical protein